MPQAVVAVAPSKRARGYIVKKRSLAPRSFAVVEMDEIISAMTFAQKYAYFALGMLFCPDGTVGRWGALCPHRPQRSLWSMI